MSRDRFDQLCELSDEYWETTAPIDIEAMYAKMMRREHAALTRAVKRLQVDKYASPNVRLGYAIAISDVQSLLAGRKGRTG